MDFGDLKDDKSIQQKLENFHNSVDKIDNLLQTLLKADYAKLSLKDKIDYDLFLDYTLNTLYWMFLRCKGEDPNQNEVKSQLNRIKEYMLKAKEAHERKTIRPRIDQPAATRFVKHGIKFGRKDTPQKNKHIIFDD